MQCSSCGLRYPPEQTLQYSHHLDWHFRQNKKQQESTKKANIRKFYFSVPDWLQYEEIEDVEERGKFRCHCLCIWSCTSVGFLWSVAEELYKEGE